MTPLNAGHTCGECGHWNAGECRRFPPQMAVWPTDNQHPIIYSPAATFPDRAATDGACGEWAALEWSGS